MAKHPAGSPLRDPEGLFLVVDGQSLEGSLRCLRQYLVVQSPVGHRSDQAAVLRLQAFESSGLVNPEASILGAPPVDGLLGHSDAAGSLGHRAALDYGNLSLS